MVLCRLLEALGGVPGKVDAVVTINKRAGRHRKVARALHAGWALGSPVDREGGTTAAVRKSIRCQEYTVSVRANCDLYITVIYIQTIYNPAMLCSCHM